MRNDQLHAETEWQLTALDRPVLPVLDVSRHRAAVQAHRARLKAARRRARLLAALALSMGLYITTTLATHL